MAGNDVNEEFFRTYQHYIEQIARLDLSRVAATLGLAYSEKQITISLLKKNYRVGPKGILNETGEPPGLDTCVILSKYLIMCPNALPPQGHWSAYRDFKDTGPLTVYFRNEVEMGIVRTFTGEVSDLNAAAKRIGGYVPDTDAAYSFKMQFDVLPYIPLLVLFNDADEEFPADCSVLFRSSAEIFLDGESLAILAHRLVRVLCSG